MQVVAQEIHPTTARAPANALSLIHPEIRPMESYDFAGIRELLAKTPGIALLPFETDEVLAAALTMHPGASTVAVTRDGTVVGCCFAVHDGLRASFRHVAVAQEFQGYGLGAKLLEPGYAYFRHSGISRIIIQVGDKNDAQLFWAKQGFRLDSGRGGRAVQMTKDLEPSGIIGPNLDGLRLPSTARHQ